MLELKQTQRLSPVLTVQLQQAIKLLQLSKLELVEAIELEMKENPILEISDEEAEPEPEETRDEKKEMQELLERYSPSEEYFPGEDKEAPDYENMVRKTYNLRDHLRWQIGLSDFDPTERVVAEWIIGNIDDNIPDKNIVMLPESLRESLSLFIKKNTLNDKVTSEMKPLSYATKNSFLEMGKYDKSG